MRRLALAPALVALCAGALDAEARARGRSPSSPSWTSSRPAATSATPDRHAGTPSAASARPSFVVLPSVRGPTPTAASTRPADLPTGSVAPAVEPPRVVGPAAAERPAPKPRDPCASDKLFGAGLGFCAVN